MHGCPPPREHTGTHHAHVHPLGASKKRRASERERERDRNVAEEEDDGRRRRKRENSKSLNLSDDLERQVLLAAAAAAAAALFATLARSRDVGLDLVLGHRDFVQEGRAVEKERETENAPVTKRKSEKNEKRVFLSSLRSLSD